MQFREQDIAAMTALCNGKPFTSRMSNAGSRPSAETILERAREAGVYVHESPELVALLMRVDFDTDIPPELYVAIGEFLIWLQGIEQSPGAHHHPAAPNQT